MDKLKGWHKTAIAVAVVSIVLTVFMIRTATKFMNQVNQAYENLVINDVDISQVADGLYTGSFDLRIVAADVSVKVRNGRIESVKIVRHSHGRGGAGEAVVESVLQAQSLAVDAVSGATMSSKVILKAIENALTGEVQAGEVQTGEVQTGEVQTGEVQAGEVQTGEVQAGEVQDDSQ